VKNKQSKIDNFYSSAHSDEKTTISQSKSTKARTVHKNQRELARLTKDRLGIQNKLKSQVKYHEE
jgi:hypothetical protein